MVLELEILSAGNEIDCERALFIIFISLQHLNEL